MRFLSPLHIDAVRPSFISWRALLTKVFDSRLIMPHNILKQRDSRVTFGHEHDIYCCSI